MSEQSVSAQNRKKRAPGSDDARTPEEVKVRTSCTTVLDLIDDCWRVVLDYLEVGDQLSFASSNESFEQIFMRYASHRYKHIDKSLTTEISFENLKQLLQIVGEHLVSYKQIYCSRLDGNQHLRLLRNHCTNLEHLQMSFEWDEWDDLNSLTKLKSLDADLGMGDRCSDFVSDLKQFTCLRKLKLSGAWSFRVLHLDQHDQLESLEEGDCSEFDTESLMACCRTMKQLRHLDYGVMSNLSENNFKILVASCPQLERLVFGVTALNSTVPYELVCQLPRLQHLHLSLIDSLRESLIEGLINKRGSPLESLIMDKNKLSADQVKNLCHIYTLKELRVSCDTVPLDDLLKLKNLLYLHISMPITTDQILILLEELPHLKVLNLRDDIEQFNDSSFVNRVRTWISQQIKQRGKIKIYLGYTDIKDILHANPFVELVQGFSGHILINKECF